ncbi:MAG: hypothetical protein JWN86_4084 [Planctomycetota bacterium]|nr:hypothetical protein [Planctomycetota bacterium]
MDQPHTRPRRRTMVLAVVFAAICLTPLALRAVNPSLYSDDVTRIEQLRMAPSLRAILFVPFNEHMAPVFQVVSWVAWECAGHRLVGAPMAFTLASFVPHVLNLVMLGVFLRRELKSTTTALLGVAAFGLSGVISETFNWYSASSFTWAMLGTIAAVDTAGRATTATTGARRAGWLTASLMAALLAPAGSGIGLLAGPMAALRLIAAAPGASLAMRLAGVVPMVGTGLYVAVCSLFRFRDVLADSLVKNVDLYAAMRNVACVPADVLLPGLFGRPSIEPILPDVIAIAVSVLGLLAVLIWAKKDAVRRPLILIGLGLIGGGYALTFGMRSFPGSPVVLTIQRYQLFPQLGLVLLLCLAMRSGLARFDTTPGRSLQAAVIGAVALLLVQLGPIRQHAQFFRWPEQAKTLAAIEHLAEICVREGIARDQCLAAVEPIRTRWFDHDLNALMLLPAHVPLHRRPDVEVAPIVFGALSLAEREALCGGMNLARHLKPPAAFSSGDPVAVGRLVRTFEVRETGSPNHWTATGWASYLEFDLSARSPDARVLSLPVAGPVELWWADENGKWSESRSVRWWPSTSASAEATDWAVPLEKLPHWETSRIRLVRVVPRKSGIMAVGTPRLLR